MRLFHFFRIGSTSAVRVEVPGGHVQASCIYGLHTRFNMKPSREQSASTCERYILQFNTRNKFVLLAPSQMLHLGMRVGLNVLLDDGHVSAKVFTNRRILDATVVVNDSVQGVLEHGNIYQEVIRLGCDAGWTENVLEV